MSPFVQDFLGNVWNTSWSTIPSTHGSPFRLSIIPASSFPSSYSRPPPPPTRSSTRGTQWAGGISLFFFSSLIVAARDETLARKGSSRGRAFGCRGWVTRPERNRSRPSPAFFLLDGLRISSPPPPPLYPAPSIGEQVGPTDRACTAVIRLWCSLGEFVTTAVRYSGYTVFLFSVYSKCGIECANGVVI